MSATGHTATYFLLTPSRLARIASASRSIFGHVGAASAYQPYTLNRRSPRPYLHKKFREGKLANLNWPHIQPQLLEGRIWRHLESEEERRDDKWEAEREKEQMAEAEAEGKIQKKEKVVLKKGKRKSKED